MNQKPEYAAYDDYLPNKKENIFLKIAKKIGKAMIDRLFNMFITLLMLFIIVVIISMAFIGSSKTPSSSYKSSFLELAFPAGIQETPADFITKDYLSLYEVLEAVEHAEKDTAVKGLILKLDTSYLSTENIAELSKKIEKFKKNSKKKVYAYGNYISASNYRLAICADEIIMTPSASSVFSLEGYAKSFPYYKGLADKAGVKFNVIHIGDYKTYGENYSKDKMSNELREELGRIYENIYSGLLNDIEMKRKISKSVLNAGIEDGSFALLNSFEAKEFNFIDETMYYEEFMKKIGAFQGKEKNVININNYVQDKSKHYNYDTFNKIAVIFAEGDITMSEEEQGVFASNSISPYKMSEMIDNVIDDNSVKGVVIRVNSPGGSALASEIILKKIEELNKIKPVFISMGNTAASGGYYISSKATKIYAEAATITGSIGVVSLYPTLKELTDKIGVNFETIKYGKYSDMGNSVKDASPEEIEVIRKTMLKTYEEFKNRVAEGRKIKPEDLEKIAQGKIWTGQEAASIGLVDEIGGLNDTVDGLAKYLKIKNYDVMPVKRQIPLTDMVKYEILKNLSIKTDLEIEIMNNPEIKNAVKSVKRFDKFNKHEMLMLMPNDIFSGGEM